MEDDEKPPAAPIVTVRNTAGRPLTFHVAGRTLRLPPGDRLDVPKSWLGSAELKRFCGTGLVVAETLTPETGREEEEEGGEDVGVERDPRHRPKPPKGESKQMRTGKDRPTKPQD